MKSTLIRDVGTTYVLYRNLNSITNSIQFNYFTNTNSITKVGRVLLYMRDPDQNGKHDRFISQVHRWSFITYVHYTCPVVFSPVRIYRYIPLTVFSLYYLCKCLVTDVGGSIHYLSLLKTYYINTNFTVKLLKISIDSPSPSWQIQLNLPWIIFGSVHCFNTFSKFKMFGP